ATMPPDPGCAAVDKDTTKNLIPAALAPLVRTVKTVVSGGYTVDFVDYPRAHNKAGSIWSVWGKGLVAHGKFFSTTGDHLYPDGNSWVWEYDPATKTLRAVGDTMSAFG